MIILPHQTEEELKALILTEQTKELLVDIAKLGRHSSIEVYIKCVICEQPKKIRFKSLMDRQGLTCSKECNRLLRSSSQKKRSANESIIIKEKRRLAHKVVYQDLNRVEEINQKRSMTALATKGVTHFSKVPEIRDKISKGVQEKYNNDPEVLKKRFATNEQKYGHTNFLASEIGIATVKKHNQSIFGTNFPFQNPLFREKVKGIREEILSQKYRTINAAKVPELIEKRTESFHANRIKQGKDYSKEFWLAQTYGYNCKINPNQELPEFWGKGSLLKLQMICGVENCGKYWFPVWNDIVSGRTQTCGCQVGVSVAEIRVFEFVKTLCPDAIHTHKINNIEVDIFIPSLQVAIEYNGLFFHRAEIRGIKDARKAQGLQLLGIRYVGIFEDEWLQKQDMVKRYLISVCKKKENVFQMRPQQVRVSFLKQCPSEVKQFLSDYHYAGGNTVLTDTWAIYNDMKLIGVLGCGNPVRQTIKEDVEIKRICLHPEYHVPGLWSYIFVNHVKPYYPKGTSITSFSDNRRDNGILYKHLGFTAISLVRPDYYWCKNQQRFHKARFQWVTKDQTELTENEYMMAQGYFKVFDCGKTKWSIVL